MGTPAWFNFLSGLRVLTDINFDMLAAKTPQLAPLASAPPRALLLNPFLFPPSFPLTFPALLGVVTVGRYVERENCGRGVL